MRRSIWAGVLFAGGLVPMSAPAQSVPSVSENGSGAITVSCYRGPLRAVVWDRPNAVFVDSLTQLGYSRARATEIGEEICLDEAGVGDPAHQLNQIRSILRAEPPG